MEEAPLSGGQMTSVVRIGNTVHRTTTDWTSAVHQLLKHLEAVNFEGVPRVLGIDPEGCEILSYIDGEAGYFDTNKVVPKNLWSDTVLVEAAKFLRNYHDATVDFIAAPNTRWQFTHPEPKKHEIICHNDFAPWNSIFEGGRFKAIIDFDTAGPGPRIDDIAYAAYSFAPMCRPEKYFQLSVHGPVDQARKLKLFCDGYGREYCEGIVDAIIARIQKTIDWVEAEAKAGDVRFQRKISEGHVKDYEADVIYLQHNRDRLSKWVN
jgi:hypothetical protein